MHARRRALSSLSPRDISSEREYFYQRGRSGIFTRRKVADCLYGGTYISPFWGPLMNARLYDLYIYIYTFSPSREEGRRRDFTSVRSSKHRRPSSSRSRRRTKDDWTGGQDALCGYECFFSEGIFLREKKISTIFSSFLSFYRGMIFHNLARCTEIFETTDRFFCSYRELDTHYSI